MKQCKMKGTVEMFVTEPDGTKKLIQKRSNTITAAFMSKCAENLVDDQDMIFDNMFIANTTQPTDGMDGMVFYEGDAEVYYSFITTKTHPTATTVIFAGTFTGTAVKITNLQLGLGWVNQGSLHGFALSTGDGGFPLARITAGSGWTEADFTAIQTVTINWTFEVV